MPATRSSKKVKLSNEPTSVISLSPDCYAAVFQYADANDLCSIDATCRMFRDTTDPVWSQLALERFGIELERGKHAWRRGKALTRPRTSHICELHDPPEYGFLYPGSPATAANNNIMVHTSDDIDGGAEIDVAGQKAVAFRDARTLNFIRTRTCAITAFEIVICGPECAEIIVTSNYSQLVAQRGARTQLIEWETILRRKPDEDDYNDYIKLAGSEMHLLAAYCGQVHIFSVGFEPLLSYATSTPLSHAYLTLDRKDDLGLAWESGVEVPTTFAYSCESGIICIWKLNLQSSQAEHINDIVDVNVRPSGRRDSATTVPFQAIAVAKRFVAGSPAGTQRIRVYDRLSGAHLHNLCDIAESLFTDAIYGLSMEAVGDLLITSSTFGNSLCVWNMKSGTMYHRYDHDEGAEVTSMVGLRSLDCPAFVNNARCLTLFAFPESTASDMLIKCIKKREAFLRRVGSATEGYDSEESSESYTS
jgi:hypothetical protein